MIEFVLGFETGVLLTLGLAAGACHLARRRATRQVVSQIEASRASAQKATDELVSVMQNIAAMNGAANTRPERRGLSPIETATIIPLKKETHNDPQN